MIWWIEETSGTWVVQKCRVFIRSKGLEISTTQYDDELVVKEKMEQEDIECENITEGNISRLWKTLQKG